MASTYVLSFRISMESRERLMARLGGRSVTNYIRDLVEKDLYEGDADRTAS